MSDPPPADTVAGLLLERLGDHAVGLRFEDRAWSWDEVVRQSAQRARLADDLLHGAAGRHIGILLDNVPEYLFWLGAAALGAAVAVGVNPTRRGDELGRDIRFTDCSLLVTDGRGAELLDGLDTGVPPERVLRVDRPWPLEAPPTDEPQLPGARPEDLLLLLFTSGTTGAPKAVRCTQGRLALIARRAAALYDFRADDVCYCPMPLFHGNAVMALWAPAMAVGASVALAGRFSATRFVEDVRHLRATRFTYVGKALAYVLATPERADDADNPLRLGFGTEASAPDRQAFERRFGCRLVEGYGSSEGGISINVTPDTPPGALGPAPVGEDLAVCGADGTERERALFDQSGQLLNAEEAVGEIVSRTGARGFEGYYAHGEADTERTRRGWYWSGDLGYRDQAGFFYFAGRGGDWLRVDSENFAAAPVERVLERHPDVAAAAVYPVPDQRSGDQVMAALELRPGAAFEALSFLTWLTGQPDLGSKWAPRYVRITKELPLTATGKVTKARLRAEGWECQDPVWHSPGRDLHYRQLTGSGRAALRRELEAHGRAGLLEDGARRRCLVVQHAEPEGPGAIGALLSARGVHCEPCLLFAGARLPEDLAGFDGLVVMGGPMSASSDAGFPTRRQELSLLDEALRRGVPTLGVCLGAQLLAVASGGAVFAGPSGPEIGWGEVRLSPAAADDLLFGALPETMEVLHWHGDTFRLGPGDQLLASSSNYRAQAFRTGGSAWGLQFHLELDRQAARRMVDAFADEAALADGGADAIVEGTSPAGPAPGSPAARVLDRFAALVATGHRVARRKPSDVL